MAQATPLAKGLIAVIIIAAASSAAWHLGLKDMVKGQGGGASSGAAVSPADSSQPLGSPENPLRVSLVSFHGYAPALVANGNSLKTQTGSIYGKKGLNVEFIIQDDIPTLSTIFESGTAQCAWRRPISGRRSNRTCATPSWTAGQ